ncbi:hypothetical protein HanPSC8_Chr01g0015841 [Helianthus annuus]|nr:hypothetical protein HanPSC8_Chr01g0015841 [Helianthus annuus]
MGNESRWIFIMMMGSWVLLKLHLENRMMLLALQHRNQKPQCFYLLQQIQKSVCLHMFQAGALYSRRSPQPTQISRKIEVVGLEIMSLKIRRKLARGVEIMGLNFWSKTTSRKLQITSIRVVIFGSLKG